MYGGTYFFEAEVFKALAHPTRIQILQLLRDGERCVCEIVPALKMEQPNVSRHLQILKKEGILSSYKDGLRVIYSVNDPKVFQVLDLCQELLKNYWEKRHKTLAMGYDLHVGSQ